MPLIEPGRKAPAFNLKDQNGDAHKLGDFAGSPLVIFFYPKDLTSGCTDEACQFQSLRARFRRKGASVIAISILGERSKKKFADKHGLDYPLLADSSVDDDGKPAPKTCPKYGVWVEKSMYGRRYMGIQRTTYLIGAGGKVARRWDKVKVPGHAEEVLAALSELDQ
jgi:peroxiredoxin Q/BCP